MNYDLINQEIPVDLTILYRVLSLILFSPGEVFRFHQLLERRTEIGEDLTLKS